LARIFSDEERPLTARTVAKARSQSLWDHQPKLRSCLKRVPWESFTPEPRWHWW
jgi:hypothetical protein